MSISVQDLLALGPNGATIINAGSHAGSKEIRGAVRYRPHDLLEPEHLAIPIAHGIPVVLYGESDPTDELQLIAEKLRTDGFDDVRVLDGGFKAYEAADGPTQEASMEQVVPPQRPSEVQDLDRRP